MSWLDQSQWQVLQEQADLHIDGSAKNANMQSMLEAARTMQRSNAPNEGEIALCNPTYDELLKWLYVDAYMGWMEPKSTARDALEKALLWKEMVRKCGENFDEHILKDIKEDLKDQKGEPHELTCRVHEMDKDLRKLYNNAYED